MICPTGSLTYNIAATAGYYSALAGILAGFSFAAIILVIPGSFSRQSGPQEAPAEAIGSDLTDAHVLVALLVAFVGLIISTVQYAELAGESSCAEILGRAENEEVLGGVLLAIVCVTLLFAVVRLLEHARVGGVVTGHFRFMTAVIAPALALYLVGLAVQDASYAPWIRPAAKNEIFGRAPGGFEILVRHLSYELPASLLIVCLLMWVAQWCLMGRVIPILPIETPLRARTQWALYIYPYLSLALILLAVAWSSSLADWNPRSQMTHAEILGWFLVCDSVLAVQSGSLLFLRVNSRGPGGCATKS